jgi:hypothetical protein
MNTIAALLLLTSASDSFDSFTGWTPGIRPGIETAIVQQDGDSCLRISTQQPASDLVKSFPRPVLASERPFAQCHIWLPPFEQWPTTNQNYAGFRLTITREQGGLVWPGIFIARDNGQPAFICRILQDHFGRSITSENWWTLGVKAMGSTDGRISFYAAPGRVTLTEADLFFTDPDPWTTVQSFDGWFLQVSSSLPFYVGDVQLYANVPPLHIERAGGAVTLTAGYPGMTIERSTNLLSWQAMEGFTDAIVEAQQFYRQK